MAEIQKAEFNGGWLRQDGNPGNKGGGRPKDRIRALAAEGGNKAVQRIIKLLESDEQLSTTDLRGCADVLLKYGIGTKTETELVVTDPEIIDKACAWVAERHGEQSGRELYAHLRAEVDAE